MVKDIELLNDVDVLFEKDIVLFGAGSYGYRMLRLLSKCGIKVTCFADNDKKKVNQKLLEYRIVDIIKLKEICKSKEIIIIVTSIQFDDEIIESLYENGLHNVDIYSYYAIKFALELHIEDTRFNEQYRKEFKQNREIWRRNNYVCNRMMPAIFQLNVLPDILVYQPSKVASSTMYISLQGAGCDSVQIHTFQPNKEYVTCMSQPGFFVDKRFEFILEDLQFYKKYYQQRKETTKIITMVREPVARDISEYLTFFDKNYMLSDKVYKNTYQGAEKLLEELSQTGNYGYQFDWFDQELKEFTGIDIFSYPFNKKEGYSIVKQGNMEILIMKMEQINENETVIARFVDNPGFKIIKNNIGELNPYKYIYKELKRNIKISQKVIDRYYKNNKRMDFFYTKEEKEKFIKQYNIY